MNGYIKLHRKMTEWEWYKDIPTKTLYIHLLLKANWSPINYQGVVIESGTVVTTIKELSDETHLSIQQTRTAISHLKSTNEITIQTSSKFSIITLLNYTDYQGSDKGSDKQVTNERQTSDKPPYSKEIKEVKEVKNIDRAKRFCPPTLDEVKAYCLERNNTVDAEKFFDYYEANGWVQGKGKPVKDWKACVRTWERSGFNQTLGNKNQKETYTEHGAYW